MRSLLARGTLFARHVWVGLRLTLVSALALGAGFVGVAVAAVAFGGVTEDVTQRNGLATSDAMHLRWFVDHRPGLLVSAARVVSEIGSPPVLGLIAVAAAVALWMRG